MYDVGVALRRFRGLIRWTARKYAIRGHFRLSIEDLEAEGLLVLVRCCRSFPDSEFRFARYFKRSFHNHLKKLYRFDRQHKRIGTEVELETAIEVPEVFSEVRERLASRAKELEPHLSPQARRFMHLMLEPTAEVVEFAWRDFCRRNKLRSLGQRVSGWNRCRVRLRHIRGVLRMSAVTARRTVREIRREAHRPHFS